MDSNSFDFLSVLVQMMLHDGSHLLRTGGNKMLTSMRKLFVDNADSLAY